MPSRLTVGPAPFELPRLPRLAAVLAGVVVLAVSLVGCSAVSSDGSVFGVLSPYRIEVVQGNVVTKEMAQELRPGLSRDQVRAALGSPLLADAFHADRWDYVFSIRRQGTTPQQRRVTVFFDNDRLTRFDAEALPSEQDFVASIDTSKQRRGPVPTLELTDAQIKALPLPPVPAASDAGAAPTGAQRTYPPLEPVNR